MVGKLLRRSPAYCGDIAAAYRYLLLAWWKASVKRENLNRWVLRVTDMAEVIHAPGEGERRAIRRRAHFINLAARLPLPWARCLQRSLALCLWLRNQDVTAQLKIGVRRSGQSLEAHAWVEYLGRVINDSQRVTGDFVLMNPGQDHSDLHELGTAIRR